MKRLLLILMVLGYGNSFAQWNPDTAMNSLVVDSASGDMKALSTSDGRTYVVFWKVVSAPTNYELRMQLLNADGTQALGSDGVLVSNALPMSTFTVIWNIFVDADDNLYIGATGTGGGEPAYAFKLDTDGNRLWGANGINVGSGYAVTILPLSSGEAIVSWYPGAQGLMQKYDASGNAVWGSSQAVVNGGDDTVPANLFELSGGDYVLVFHVLLGGINSNLYAQRYDSNGVSQWTNPTQISNQATAFNRTYSVAQDGNIAYFGYFGSTGVRFDSFLQRINDDGSLPWGINGSDFDTNQTNYEMGTNIAFDPSSQNIWAACTYTNTSQSMKGTYVQNFDKTTGARGLSETAKEVFAIGSEDVQVGELQLKNDSPLFLFKRGADNGASPITLHVTYLDDMGDFVWPEVDRPIATFSANKSRIQYTKRVNNQSVAVFIEDKGPGQRIYAQNFLDEALGVDDHDFPIQISFVNPIPKELEIDSSIPVQRVSVYSILGQLILSETNEGSISVKINTESWQAGSYVMKVESAEGQVKIYKLLKM